MKYSTSVALATYNGERYIVEQLTSILNQSHSVDEVVIYDDRSSDNTVKVIKEFIEHHKLNTWSIVINESNIGFCNNFWKAITRSSGDIVFLSDQDDVWYKDKVSEMLNLFQDETINMVASSYDICDADGKIDSSRIRWHRDKNDSGIEDINFDNLIIGSRIRGCSVGFRKSIIENENLLDLHDSLGHDWLLTCYASLKGRAVFFNKILFKYRIHDSNSSSVRRSGTRQTLSVATIKTVKQLTNESYAFSTLSKHTLVDQQRKLLLRERANFSLRRAYLYKRFGIIKCVQLSFNLKMYTNLSRHGVLGGILIYLKDIKSSIQVSSLNRREAATNEGVVS